MFFMLNLRFKSLCFISSYINYEGVIIVQEYDKKCFYPILIKCHNHLHHVLEFEVGYANPMVEEDCGLDIFEPSTNTDELVKELVSK